MMTDVEAIMTTDGMVPLHLLYRVDVTEKIPCGVSSLSKYYLDGRLVRQDMVISVDEGVFTEMPTEPTPPTKPALPDYDVWTEN